MSGAKSFGFPKYSTQILNLANQNAQGTRPVIEKWVKDLVIVKTFIGVRFQEAILHKVSLLLEKDYKLATPEEESRGIDGFIGEVPVSIKPETYRIKKSLSEKITVRIIYYRKVKDGLTIDLTNIL